MNKKVLINFLRILVSGGLLVYLFLFQVDLTGLWQSFLSARYVYLILALLIMILGTMLRGLRWDILLRAHGLKVPLVKLVKLYFVGAFFNIFLPSGIGGDAVKMAELSRATGKTPESIGITVVDRALGIWILFILALVALPFGAEFLPDEYQIWVILLVVAGVFGGFLFMWTPLIHWIGTKFQLPAQDKLERIYQSISTTNYKSLAKASLVSLVFDGLLIIFIYFLAIGFHADVQFYLFFIFAPLISLSEAIPLSVGGLGLREFTYVLLFGPVGVSEVTATAMSLFHYVLAHVLVGVIGGVLYAIQGLSGLMDDK